MSERRPDRPARGMLIFFGLVIALAAVAFGVKFYEFFVNLSAQQGFRFAAIHLLTYLLVAGGFFLLLGYCFLSGHFSDIEQPKHDLLESEEERDHAEFD
jgi:hypothetical protein